MSNLELSLSSLAESATTAISKAKKPKNMQQNTKIAKQGGSIAKDAKQKLESIIGTSVVSSDNYLEEQQKHKLGFDKVVDELLEEYN